MRPTPETDAFSVKFKSVCWSKSLVPANICRRFERERDDARKESEYYRERYEQLKAEREAAK